MYGAGQLFTLLNDNSVTSTLSDPGYLYNAMILPEESAGQKTINFYRVGTVNGEYLSTLYVANCRAPVQVDAEGIAAAVRKRVNREIHLGVYFRVEVLPPIRPQDSQDVYNVPVEIRVIARDF